MLHFKPTWDFVQGTRLEFSCLLPLPRPLLRTGLDACLGGAALARAAFWASGVLPILPLFFRFVVLVTIHLYDPLLTGLLTPLHSASGIPCLATALWIRPIKVAPRLWDKWVSALSHSLIPFRGTSNPISSLPLYPAL